MELTDELVEINQQFESMLFNDMLLTRVAYGFLCAACLFFAFVAIYKLIRRRWSSIFFILLCTAVITWSVLSFLALFTNDLRDAEFLNTLRFIGMIPIPALLTLHISLQVSYKELRPHMILLFLVVPLLYIFLILRDLFFPGVLSFMPAVTASMWYYIVFYFYAIVALIKSYLLCFNVFYQMPPRARRSTKSTFVSVIAITLFLILDAVWSTSIHNLIPQNVVVDLLLPLATPIALAFLIYPLFDSMYIMPASDVIVTSREFIMRGLNTTVLVLNRRYQVLDWNRKDWDSEFPLPKPKYKEPYAVYLKRLLNQYEGKVSPHNTDIIIITKDGVETYFLLRAHEVGYKNRMFGYVVEISEVTPIYKKLRYFEEIAHIDNLTGLHNRNAYIDYTEQLIKEENMPLLILVGDLNELKRINDVYGHLEGDELIKTVSKIINDSKPDNAFVARVGGDEFVLLVPGGSEEQAENFIKTSNEMCGKIRSDKSTTPSVSWGFVLMTSIDQSYNDLFAEADKMMYEYKKNRVAFSSSGTLPKKAKKIEPEKKPDTEPEKKPDAEPDVEPDIELKKE